MDQHQKWLEWRRGGLGSSDAATLMGVSPWKTRYDLYKEKVLGETTQIDNDAMKHGRDTEPMVREWLEDRYEMFLEPRNIEHFAYPVLRASLDAVSFCGKHIFEIKCPYRNAKDHELAKSGKVPEKYYPQLQHQMLVTGMNRIGYVSYFEGDFSHVVYVYADDSYAANLSNVELKFWSEHVLAKIVPELTEKDRRNMQGNYDWEMESRRWANAKSMLKAFEVEEENCRKSLIDLSSGKNCEGHGVRLTSSEREGRIDFEKALIEYQHKILQCNPHAVLPDFNVEDYRKPSTINYRLSMY